MADIVFTVAQINEYISRKMFSDPFLSRVKVVGEVTNLKFSAVGHAFFSLKDSVALLGCVMYDHTGHADRNVLEDGALLEISGRISFYRKSASVQLVVETAAPHGVGDLFARLERTRQKLLEEGVFDEARKKALPYLALRVGVVTSPSGAVLHDIVSVATRRFEGVRITVYPVPVQGGDAAAHICAGIAWFNREAAADVIIVARGGGSFEDLSAFNDESVARAVFGSQLPVVSAVGHETDYTLCDMAADLRAPTPSVAAEMVVREKSEVRALLAAYKGSLRDALDGVLADRESRLALLLGGIRAHPLRLKLSHMQSRVDAGRERMSCGMAALLGQYGMRVENYRALLASLDPRGVLMRGYAIVYDAQGRAVESSRRAVGDMEIEFGDGRAAVTRR